ncbi:MAG: CHRD domain-containing protein [Acidobacteria bacterium]|nr:CHRD domain-containing protein [Acidobacteriota bacterium]
MLSTKKTATIVRCVPGPVAPAVLAWAGVFLCAAPAAAAITKGDVVIKREVIAAGLVGAPHLTHAGDGSGRLFVADQAGLIRIIKRGVLLPRPFLDLTDRIVAVNPGFDERGLLGLAFHPHYAQNGRFFVRYSAPRAGETGEPCFGTSRGCHEEILAEFSVSSDPDVANPAGAILFRVDEPQFNHNAGTVAFGPDGMLYFSLGDGGGAHDGLADTPPSHGPIGNGQNINAPLGKLLRIDVDNPPQEPRAYAIPADNPFVGTDGLDEIFAYGLRNPFRFAFDDGPGGDGRLFLADVGQNLFEEVDIIQRGGNYGWVIREGSHCFDPFAPTSPPAVCSGTGPLGEPLLDPIVDYSHAEGGLSAIGGYVYRGSRSPSLVGRYVFGDFSAAFGSPSGRLYFLDGSDASGFAIKEFIIGRDDAPYGLFLKGFGEGEDREVYALGSIALAPTGNTGVVERLVEVVNPALDIRPGACPNRLIRASLGVLPVAVLGTANFDVTSVDSSTLRLTRALPMHALGASLDGAQAYAGAGSGSTATGRAVATLDAGTNVFCMNLTFQGLLGEQTVQHVHGPATAIQETGVLFGIPGPGSFTGFCRTLTDEQETIILAGLAYVNVHSTRDPSGEIRGQILPASARPLRVHVEDAGRAAAGDLCGCSEESGNADGLPDLILKFDNQDVIATLGLDVAGSGGTQVLTVSGNRRPDADPAVTRFEFDLGGSQEEPKNTSLGTGSCTVNLDQPSGQVTVGCRYQGLSGPATAAHIHGPAQPGTNAGVIVPLAAIGGASGTVTGGGTLTPALVQAMLDGLTYVNVHTQLRPGGEIRGQIVGGEAFSASDCAEVLRRRAIR